MVYESLLHSIPFVVNISETISTKNINNVYIKDEGLNTYLYLSFNKDINIRDLFTSLRENLNFCGVVKNEYKFLINREDVLYLKSVAIKGIDLLTAQNIHSLLNC